MLPEANGADKRLTFIAGQPSYVRRAIGQWREAEGAGKSRPYIITLEDLSPVVAALRDLRLDLRRWDLARTASETTGAPTPRVLGLAVIRKAQRVVRLLFPTRGDVVSRFQVWPFRASPALGREVCCIPVDPRLPLAARTAYDSLINLGNRADDSRFGPPSEWLYTSRGALLQFLDETIAALTLPSFGALDGEDWEELRRTPQRVLKFMAGRQRADVNELALEVWGKDIAGLKPYALSSALKQANRFLAARQCPRRLSKPRNEDAVIWAVPE
jgi:hypothetical protein